MQQQQNSAAQQSQIPPFGAPYGMPLPVGDFPGGLPQGLYPRRSGPRHLAHLNMGQQQFAGQDMQGFAQMRGGFSIPFQP